MRFRPCIDIHNGKVKQIVGGSLRDEGDQAKENFVSTQDAAFFAEMYQKDRISGGHVILLNAKDSPFYEKTKEQAMLALRTYPGGLQVGGGITDENAKDFLEAGASHVIVTSFVFKNGVFYRENLENLLRTVGKEHLVLDLSCRRKEDGYSIVTDRWQKFTDVKLSEKVLDELSGCCDEFLVHAVDAEGKAQGIERELADMLGRWQGIPGHLCRWRGKFCRSSGTEKTWQRSHRCYDRKCPGSLWGKHALPGSSACVCRQFG